MRYIKLRHEVVHAHYAEPTGKWHVRIRRPKPNGPEGEFEEFEDVGDVLLTAFGAISRWKWPEIEGMKDFKGELHHTAGFNPEERTWVEASEKWKDKRVGVVGVVSLLIMFCIPCVLNPILGLVGYSNSRRTVPSGRTHDELRARADMACSALCRGLGRGAAREEVPPNGDGGGS